jgi:hypothetical protein
LAVIAIGAAACGSGGGGSAAQVSIHALVRRTGCPAATPRQASYRGTIVFSARGGRRRVAHLDRRGRAGLSLKAGRYRVEVSGPPRARRLVRARLDGRVLPVAAGGRFPVTIGRSGAAALVIVVSAGPIDCNALGASG